MAKLLIDILICLYVQNDSVGQMATIIQIRPLCSLSGSKRLSTERDPARI